MRIAMLAALVLGSLAAGLRAEPTTLPTTQEVRELIQEEKYVDAMQRVNRLLALKGAAAKPYDRYELLLLKGETHLHMKALNPAMAAFADAAKATQDAYQRAVARATELLFRRAKGFTYTSRVSGDAGKARESFDLIDTEQRKKAIAALLEDELAALEPKSKAAREATSLKPVVEAIQAVTAARDLEIAADIGDSRTKKMLERLDKRAQDVMNRALKTMGNRADELERVANELVDSDVEVADRNGHHTERRTQLRGLSGNEIAELRSTISTCEKMVPAAHEIGDAVEGEPALYDKIIEDSEEVRRRAADVVNKDYRTARRR